MGISNKAETRWRDRTIGNAARLKLEALDAALGLGLDVSSAQRLELLLGDVAEQFVGTAPLWTTDITDDGTPFEFSLAVEREAAPELRVLIERRLSPFDVASNWTSGLQLHNLLARTHAVDLKRFELVSDLFSPDPSRAAQFAIWHATSLSPHARDVTRFKVYLNPQVHGLETAQSCVQRALERLNMPQAWAFIEARLSERPNNRLIYLSLDLHRSDDARAKVYVAHHAATEDEVETAVHGTCDYIPDQARQWVRTLLRSRGPYSGRPVITAYAFSNAARVPRATSHFPVRNYLATDLQALDNYVALMEMYGVDAKWVAAGLAKWVDRSLDSNRGMVTYVSCRPSAAGVRSTLYLAPQLYAVPAVQVERRTRLHSSIQELSPARSSLTMRAVQDRIDRHTLELRQHSFLRRLTDGGQPLTSVRNFARKLTFFVLAFQDMLRVAVKQISHPALSKLASVHQQEDKGHDVWFLLDLRGLAAEPSLRELFSLEHEAARDVAYELIAMILRARDDRTRIAVLMVLEATAAEFFPRIVACLEQLGMAEQFIFFGRHHLNVEQNHTSAMPEEREDLSQIDLDPDAAREALDSVDDAFRAMTHLATELDRSM